MFCETVAIIGVGLIGGSVGLAVRQRGLAQRIIGVVRRREIIPDLLRSQIVNEATTNLPEAVQQADLIVVCTPVDTIAEYVLQAMRYAPARAILTDAGSTKARIVAEVEKGWKAISSSRTQPNLETSDWCRFVGSHPLAGSEKSGHTYADPRLFAERWVIVTPSAYTCPKATEQIAEFWQALGARIQFMAPEDHDRALALTSHLPHLVASALAGILPSKWSDLAASGFRDTTRIAASLPEIWAPIFLHNHEAVLEALQLLDLRLQEFAVALRRGDRQELLRLLTEGKLRRDSLSAT